MSTPQRSLPALLEERIEAVLGDNADPMPVLEERAREILPELPAIVWECDARTLAFSFVGQAAERVLGYPRERWTHEPAFWADVVVHADDREPSVRYCVTETREGRDHDFEYRAQAEGGRVVRLRDVVRVLPGADGTAERLRGIMIPLSPS
jgi:PAS domain-containing protein